MSSTWHSHVSFRTESSNPNPSLVVPGHLMLSQPPDQGSDPVRNSHAYECFRLSLVKMLENGFNGFPRASRSIRARGPPNIGKKFENVKSHQPFEILASVAGKLLDKSEKCSLNHGNIDRTSCDDDYSSVIDPTRRIPSRSGTLESYGKRVFRDHHCLSGVIDTKTEQPIGNNRRVKDKIDTDCKTSELVGKEEEVSDQTRTTCAHEKSQKIFPFKKRKFFNLEPLSPSESDHGFNGKHGFDSPPESRSNGKFCGADQQSSLSSEEECNVKLSIKSFKVPELFIDISTNATVGSLKRMVMKAVTSILGDGLHVGILVQGKKVRDDNKTLVQTGIFQDGKSHNLGFILEPKKSLTALKNEPLLSRHLASQQGSASKFSLNPDQPKKKNSYGCVGTELSSVKSLADTPITKANPDSQALALVQKTSTKPLAVVPLHQKPGHSHEYGHRRIRRPFSVSEVEVLVWAVEKLGTGRWRDVKCYAFDNAKHRTYVDLKDKWKTLVHTAQISPQQRRGEPVPQELLDRVLAAQAFWSHCQAKQQALIQI